jgi:hypothetical protein
VNRLTIAVLTGRRPALLERTLTSFVKHHGDVWDDACRIVLHNAGDDETVGVLGRFRFDVRHVTDRLLPIGEASTLLTEIASDTGADLLLRLEDDWEAQPQPWFDQAVRLLCQVDQVRLRRSDERVSSRCAVCRRNIRWTVKTGFKLSDHAHWTFNPTLTRMETAVNMLPVASEKDAMRKTHPVRVAQLTPGVFTHIGNWSLRKNGGAV